jgi:hypothetical protein
MKQLIVAVAIALCASPALAEREDLPFEQNELDRALPSVPENVTARESISSDRMPFEQTLLDRGYLGDREHVMVAQIGGLSYKSGEEAGSPWATDHNFIAPAP